MTLTSNLNRYFSPKARQDGRIYLVGNAVHLLKGDQDRVTATVQGTQSCTVALERQDNTLFVDCSCPQFQDQGPCRHVYATLLKAEGLGYLLGPQRRPPTHLEEDPGLRLEMGLGSGDGDEDDPEEYDEGPVTPPGYRPYAAPPAPQPPRTPPPPRENWQKQLNELRTTMERQEPSGRPVWSAGKEILYVVDVPSTLQGRGLALEVMLRERKKNGEWGKPKGIRIPYLEIPKITDPVDREILTVLAGAREQSFSPYYNSYYNYGNPYAYDSLGVRYALTEPMQETLLPRACQTGRCHLRLNPNDPELHNLRWDDGPPWEFWLAGTPGPSGKDYVFRGELRRGGERLPLAAPVLLVAGGLVFLNDKVARLQDFGAFPWVTLLRKQGMFSVPVRQKETLVTELVKLPKLPRLDLPEDLRFTEVTATPKPHLKVKPGPKPPVSRYRSRPQIQKLHGELSFEYEGQVIPANDKVANVYDAANKVLIHRNRAAEAEAEARLRQAGFREAGYHQNKHLELAPRNLPSVVRNLLAEGWNVEAEGKLYRRPGEIKIDVRSGIDWFELEGKVDFGETSARLPELLAALKRGDNSVQLDDGTFGLLPEDWLKKYGVLAGLGTAQDGKLRFARSQVGLLDALLASQPEAHFDEGFARAREELRNFEGIQPADPTEGFIGQLRAYQREGLGWLHFLKRFGFGGCLADDMGLGKTVQVLALLEERRAQRAASEQPGQPAPPSLIVVPRSLVFNWKAEAARFAPKLRVLDHTGQARDKKAAGFPGYDAVLTTYGTLRQDILQFKDIPFDYCVLDESQAIKNAGTESAKAVRLLRADHRLALSGTPIENHLGELWSLFDYLNPGMLGTSSVLRLGGSGARNPDPETRELLARALRPFILRRTKSQVAKDLPEKLEQTLYCELDPHERKLYDELRDHYRRALLDRIEREGMNKAKIMILEALLRLRQAACHPGLIDKNRVDESSSKLEMLLERLTEVVEEGHKALVFSQFTSLLAIARARLDKEKVTYEYLDGRTRDRAARVERFQTDPNCPLFLISLKAGGLGLNLTAAEYVFLLDPWWNPAVEAQAIDRAHRIGQTNKVFAYRLIAKDTVEEKVLELQKSKKDLADAIINADNSLIRSLGREDLELLLS